MNDEKKTEPDQAVTERKRNGLKMLLALPVVNELNDREISDILAIFERAIERLKSADEVKK